MELGRLIEITLLCINNWQGPITINGDARDFLYRFCTADSAFEPLLLFLPFGESITYMLSILLHSSIPTSSTNK
jgi:hypothetical protein